MRTAGTLLAECGGLSADDPLLVAKIKVLREAFIFSQNALPWPALCEFCRNKMHPKKVSRKSFARPKCFQLLKSLPNTGAGLCSKERTSLPSLAGLRTSRHRCSSCRLRCESFLAWSGAWRDLAAMRDLRALSLSRNTVKALRVWSGHGLLKSEKEGDH